jgi:hypothetical protein
VNRVDISEEMQRARADFHEIVEGASAQDLGRRSDGTRWTNRQLLFYIVLRCLMIADRDVQGGVVEPQADPASGTGVLDGVGDQFGDHYLCLGNGCLDLPVPAGRAQ